MKEVITNIDDKIMPTCYKPLNYSVKDKAAEIDALLKKLEPAQYIKLMTELNISDDPLISDIRTALLNTAFDGIFNYPNNDFVKLVGGKFVVHMPPTKITAKDLYTWNPDGADKLVVEIKAIMQVKQVTI